MASVANPFKGNVYSKKRSGGSLSGRPQKRMFSASSQQNNHASPRRPVSSAPGPEKGGSTGLEGLIDFNQTFVEASKATYEDENKGKSALLVEKDYATLITEKEQLAASISMKPLSSDGVNQLGFNNLTGALCYRHSLLQALIHTPKFVRWLNDYHKPQHCVSDSRTCISCIVRNACTIYWSPNIKNDRQREEKLVDVVRRLNRACKLEGWSPNSAIGHGDPDDQLGWILNQMREEMPSKMFKPFDAFHNLLLDSSIQCDKCGHSSRTEGNNERHLSIPIRPKVQEGLLTSLIRRYMDEIVSDYRCEKTSCRHVSDKHRVQQIASAPDVLLIQLKRFDYTGKKDSLKVNYKTTLNLNEYRSKKCTTDLTYKLHAVVTHAGSASVGHYIALVDGGDEGWLEFDDNNVSEIDEKQVLNPSMTPYLLFYQRVEPEN